MKRKYFSVLLMGALAIASTSMVTSCKDYDDDIQNLQQQIDANKSAIEEISKLIKEGCVITSVEKATSGVTVKLNNGDTFTINNGEKGADGTPGTAWTIGTDGYWYKDGNKTDYKALGEKGEKGDTGAPGPQGPQGPQGPAGAAGSTGTGTAGTNGKYYVPNTETGCFDIYQDGEKVESTNISFIGTGVITAVKDDNAKTLTLFGVKGGEGQKGKVVISMTGDLTSLVFMPKFYLDGIEMIEYPYLNGTSLKKQNVAGACTNHDGVTVQNLGVDYKENNKAFVYGPAWAVDYHANPVNAKLAYANVDGFNVLNPAVLYTRATADELGVTSPEKNYAGTTLFNIADDGVLTVGLQVAHPDKLNPAPTKNKVTDDETWNNANTVALKVKNNEGNDIVSDYALLQPTKAKVEGLVWTKNPDYIRGPKDAAGEHIAQTGDEACGVGMRDKVHVWDTPKEALQDERHAALELYYENNTEIDLNEYVGIHLTKENIKDYMATSETKTLTPEQAKEWGLTFHFIPVMYKAGDNQTSDSHFLKSLGDGKFRAQNVDENLKAGLAAEASVGREPLVQVLVTRGETITEDNVVLDGYILLHITKQAKDNHVVNKWNNQNVVFDQCNDVDVFKTTWEQFNDYMLTQELNMSKEDFDHGYEADTIVGTKKMNMYVAPLATKGTMTPDNSIGDVFYTKDGTGTTNHTWRWVIPAEQVEKLLHDQASVTLVRYIRFNAVDQIEAKYPYIYVKMETTITRKALAKFDFDKKIAEYWFDKHAVHGTKGIFFDVVNPWDGGNINSISRGIETTMEGNTVASLKDKNYKYFFEPTPIVLKAQDGKKYTITTSGNGAEHDKIVCKYDGTHTHAFADFDKYLDLCAINYGKGAFNNKFLYAVKEGTTEAVKIATLVQETGVITLEKNDYCKKLLNATGYANLNELTDELSAHVGVVVCANGCNLAQKVKDASFIVSWERPINLITREENTVVDANTNGNTINFVDCLKFYDWRGYANGKATDANCEANQSNMWGANQWYWAYYGINKIAVDFDGIKTNLNHGTTFVPLKDVTNELTLYLLDKNGSAVSTLPGQKYEYTFDISDYNYKALNSDLLTYMNGHKGEFGRIHYTNNGDNVGEFYLQIPLTIGYTWGEFETTVTLKVERTIGQ